MRLSEITFEGPPPIDSYGPGFFRLGGKLHTGPLALIDGKASSWGGWSDLEIMLSCKGTCDVLFLGMGADIAPLPSEVRAVFDGAEIPYDLMATPSACRTYNVLLSEGRRVAACLIPV